MINPSELSGSIEMIGAPSDGAIYKFQCKNADVSKLPVENVGTGSKCIVYDAGRLFTFSAKTGKWEEMK